MINGDTFDLDIWRVRLYGLDAPEARQKCVRDAGRWHCGREATWALSKLTKEQTVRCIEKGRTPLGLVEAVCYIDDVDINAWMVSNGWAIATSSDYAGQEKLAVSNGVGIWSGKFITPERWLRGERLDNQ